MPGSRRGMSNVLRSVVTSALNITPLSLRASRSQLGALSAKSESSHVLGFQEKISSELVCEKRDRITDGRTNINRSPSPKDTLCN